MVSLSYSGFDRSRGRSGGYERKPYNRDRSDRPDYKKSASAGTPAPAAASTEKKEG